MNTEEYSRFDGVGLAGLVQRGEVSAKELARTALSITGALDPTLGAMLDIYADDIEALDQSALPDGPLKGVPFVIKDCILQAEGKKVFNGSRLCEGVRAPFDSELMRRFRAAGLVTVGMTKCPEFGFGASAEPISVGPVRNPWDISRSTGGSSGGAAAAVAAGYVPIAHGNDSAGSIRIPAAACGLVGLKPTRGRNSLAPLFGEANFGLTGEHVLSRTVRDSAAVLEATNGPAPGEPYLIPPPARPYSQEVGADTGRLRIAICPAPNWTHHPTDPGVRDAVAQTGVLLESLGHDVEEACFEYDSQKLDQALGIAWAVGERAWISGMSLYSGIKPGPDVLEAVTWKLFQAGKDIDAVTFISTVFPTFNEICRSVGPFFEQYDLLVTPTLSQPAVKLGALDQNHPDWTPQEYWDRLMRFMPFTGIFNVTGQPAISLPLYQSGDGLPIGIQIAGRFGDEATLIRIASQLEVARPWADRRPPVRAGA